MLRSVQETFNQMNTFLAILQIVQVIYPFYKIVKKFAFEEIDPDK